jgi:hypothetical protein
VGETRTRITEGAISSDIAVVPIDFLGQGALLEPKDTKLHDAVLAYAWKELADGKKLDLTRFAKSWAGLKGGEVFGICGYVLRPDIPLIRATDAEVLRAMANRMNSYFADNGARGNEAFLYIGDDKTEQRCPEWRKVLSEFGAKNAQRFSIEVK